MATETNVEDDAPRQDPREAGQERRAGTVDLDGSGNGSITVSLSGDLADHGLDGTEWGAFTVALTEHVNSDVPLPVRLVGIATRPEQDAVHRWEVKTEWLLDDDETPTSVFGRIATTLETPRRNELQSDIPEVS